MFSFAVFSGIWSLIAKVSEYCFIFIGEWVRSVTVSLLPACVKGVYRICLRSDLILSKSWKPFYTG
jgi:hypothetical protein